jgi:hypothetical protein
MEALVKRVLKKGSEKGIVYIRGVPGAQTTSERFSGR